MKIAAFNPVLLYIWLITCASTVFIQLPTWQLHLGISNAPQMKKYPTLNSLSLFPLPPVSVNGTNPLIQSSLTLPSPSSPLFYFSLNPINHFDFLNIAWIYRFLFFTMVAIMLCSFLQYRISFLMVLSKLTLSVLIRASVVFRTAVVIVFHTLA